MPGRHRNDAMPKLLRQILVFGLLTLDITLLRGNVELIHVRNHVRGLLIRRPTRHIRHRGIVVRARERHVSIIGSGAEVVFFAPVGDKIFVFAEIFCGLARSGIWAALRHQKS